MKDNLQNLIENGIKIKISLDKAIMKKNVGSYSEEILEWNIQCVNYLDGLLKSNLLLFQFIKSDQILAGLKNSRGEMISLFETPYTIKKEPTDISNILENKLDFLLSIQNKGKKVFEEIDGIKYSFNDKDLAGKLVINENDPIIFSGQTALVLSYFYIRGKDNNKYSTYKDFNIYQKNLDYSKEISSKIFSQAIRSINKTINKRNKNIKEIILQEKKTSNRNIANAYKWNYKDH